MEESYVWISEQVKCCLLPLYKIYVINTNNSEIAHTHIIYKFLSARTRAQVCIPLYCLLVAPFHLLTLIRHDVLDNSSTNSSALELIPVHCSSALSLIN